MRAPILNRNLAIGLLPALLLALALRCPQLDIRPMHNDEAVNAIKLHTLWEHGAYQYDPHEYHGPTLLYLTLGWVKLIGATDFVHLTETQLRLLPVIFGIGLILLLPLVADGLGYRATLGAAMFTAISPAMVFYSRYFIHEMLLVFFTFLTFASAWRYWKTSQLRWLLLAGAGAGLMQATKETFIFSLASLAAALIINTRFAKKDLMASGLGSVVNASAKPNHFKLNQAHMVGALTTWLVVVVVLFSSFFTNWSGPLDSLRTYLPWLHRVEGASPHIHPWYFYLQRLTWFHTGRGPAWSEGLILALALLGTVSSFTSKGLAEGNRNFIRILAIYTLVLTAIYSVIGYKTPWCLLNFWHGMILLAGVGVVVLLNILRRRAMRIFAGILVLAGAGQLAMQAWRAAITHAADPRNPYVYAQTSPDILDLIDRVKAVADCSPQKNRMLIEVVAPQSEYWPLPWYLRQFDRVGWWDALPADTAAPVIIVSTTIHTDLAQTHIPTGISELRPQTFFEMYVANDFWDAYLKNAHGKWRSIIFCPQGNLFHSRIPPGYK